MISFRPLFILNPMSAGGRTAERWRADYVPRLGEFFADHAVAFTRGPGDGAEQARLAVANGRDLVVSVGGDGTHNEVVNGLLSAGPLDGVSLGIVPAGTGGDLARFLRLGTDPVRHLEILASGQSRPCDAGRVSFTTTDGGAGERFFFNITSFGLGGEVVRRVNRSSKRLGGFLTFFLATVVTMLTFKGRRVRLVLDGRIVETRAITVAAANASHFGGGMMISPLSRIDDGLLDVVVIEGYAGVSLLSLGLSIYEGKHLDHRRVGHYRCRRVDATSDGDCLLDVDGEQPGRLPATIEIMAGALRLVAPWERIGQ